MTQGFQIGPALFHYYGIILAIAIFASFLVAKLVAAKVKLPKEVIEELAIILIIPAIAGARIYHVLHFWSYYSNNLAKIFFIWEGGLGIIGAILAGLATIFVYSKLAKLDFLKLADLAAPAAALAQSIGRIGNFVNREGFGPPTNLPWGIFIESSKRPENFVNFTNFHPTFFYEAIGNFLIFLLLILVPSKKTGVKFALYLVFYSALRFNLEFLRIDTWQIGIIKVAQAISVIGLITGILILVKIFRKPTWTFKFLV